MKNTVALIIAAGIALLPSLYAWVNILASWDPYGNTGGIKVGIVNEDEGASVGDISVNIGRDISAELQTNDKLGWTFFDNSYDAIEQTKDGDVYAAIVIPNDFSAKLLTLLDETPQKPQLDYYVNEKINAVAPKMTDSGVNTIQSQISQQFIQTVTEKVFDALNILGVNIDENQDKIDIFRSVLNLAQIELPGVSEHIDNLLDKAENGFINIDPDDEDVIFLKNVLGDAVKYSADAGNTLKEASESLPSFTSDLRGNIKGISDSLGEVENGLTTLGSSIDKRVPDITNILSDTEEGIEKLSSFTNSLSEQINDIDGTLHDQLYEDVSSILNLTEDTKTILNTLSKAGMQTDQLAGPVSDLSSRLNNIRYEVRDMRKSINNKADEIDQNLAEAEGIVKGIENKVAQSETVKAIDALLEKLRTDSVLYQDIISSLETIKNNLGIGDIDMSVLLLSSRIDSMRTSVRSFSSDINNSILDIENCISATSSSLSKLSKLLDTAGSGTVVSADMLLTNIDGAQNRLNDIRKSLEAGGSDVSEFSDELESISENLEKFRSDMEEIKNSLSDINASDKLSAAVKLCSEIRSAANTLYEKMDDEKIQRLQNTLTNASNAGKDISDLLSKGIDGTDEVAGFLDKLNTSSRIPVEDVEKFKNSYKPFLDDIQSLAHNISMLMNLADNYGLTDMLNNDPSAESDFFASPVELNTTKLFPIANYGAGLTPFYTTLCLWVGALLICALMTTKAANAEFSFTPNEEYIGKYMFFATIAVFQGLAASLGDIFLLKVQMQNPGVFVAAAVLSSFVFTMIVYTCVALFGNIGKAIGVIFLVVQLAGSGGTFPIEVTPEFFQLVYKFLPFTYSIGAMREAVGGIVPEKLILDFAVVSAYGILFLIIGLLLKRFANKALRRFNKRLGESGLLGH